MSTYGDRGNIIILRKRCEWRGIGVEVIPITLETRITKLQSCDIIFMGGAQDRQQKLVSGDFLGKKAEVVTQLIEKNIPALFVCAAYQFVGHYYKPYQGDKIPGASIFDLDTEHPGDQAKRLIGNTIAELLPSFWGAQRHQNQSKEDSGQARMTIVGFENHGGRTYLGSKMKPLAKVIKGYGNNGEDGFEGAIYKNAIGSYFHGPLLPKNPHLADWLIQKALEVKYKKSVFLDKINDDLELQAHQYIVNKIT